MKTKITFTLSVMLAAAALFLSGCEQAASISGGADAVKNLTSSITSITSSLGAVTDKASAEGAVSKLESAGATLEGLVEKLDSLPAPIREQIQSKAGGFKETFDGLVEKVEMIPGVGGVIEGPVEMISTQLDALAG